MARRRRTVRTTGWFGEPLSNHYGSGRDYMRSGSAPDNYGQYTREADEGREHRRELRSREKRHKWWPF